MKRSFSDDLRARSDSDVALLLQARPDLLSPVPPDLSALAARANSTPSSARAIDALNQWQIEVLEVCALVQEPFDEKAIKKHTFTSPKEVLNHLYRIGLLYKDKNQYRMPTGVRDALGADICGLGSRTGPDIDLDLTQAPEAAISIIEKLAWQGPRGSASDVNSVPTLKWLIEKGWLQQLDAQHVMLPAQVGLALREGIIHKAYHPLPPELSGSNIQDADPAGAMEAATFLMWVEDLLEAWSREPGQALRSGGMSVRELKRIAALLGISEACAAFVAESAYIIGLVSIDIDDQILPTTAYDIWLSQKPEDRWREIAFGWLTSSRVAGLCAPTEGKGVAPLGPELDRAAAPALRHFLLSLLSPNTSFSQENLVDVLAWHRPRRARHFQPSFVEWTLREAQWLGVTGRGAITTFGVELLKDEEPKSLAKQLPPLVDHVLLQGDHTAVAPGPLFPEIFREISMMAEVESRGTATIFRFTENSIRHALDCGYDTNQIEKFINKISKTQIPQSLQYMISDASRKHGRLRVGLAHSYLRCDDESLLVEVLNNKKCLALDLKRIAPTVIISPAPIEEVLETLRDSGYSPAAESTDGVISLISPTVMRARSKSRPPRIVGDFQAPDENLIAAAVKALRSGEHATSTQRALPKIETAPRTTASETLRVLRENLQTGVSLWIGYADSDGGLTSRMIEPISIVAGYLMAFDKTKGEVKRFAIARITGVAKPESI